MTTPPQGNSARHAAVVALGANLGEPRAALRSAYAALHALGTVVRTSALYRTAPVGGPPGQPDYLNAAALLHTALTPHDLLAELLRVEREAGRERRERWGPRTLDLDLVSYDDLVLQSADLTLPHPRTMDRPFVLAPLADVFPAWRHPETGETVEAALARLGWGGVERLADDWISDPDVRRGPG